MLIESVEDEGLVNAGLAARAWWHLPQRLAVPPAAVKFTVTVES